MRKIELTQKQLYQIQKLYNAPEQWGERAIAKKVGLPRHLIGNAYKILGIDNSNRQKI
jgi:hypothetical protein